MDCCFNVCSVLYLSWINLQFLIVPMLSFPFWKKDKNNKKKNNCENQLELQSQASITQHFLTRLSHFHVRLLILSSFYLFSFVWFLQYSPTGQPPVHPPCVSDSLLCNTPPLVNPLSTLPLWVTVFSDKHCWNKQHNRWQNMIHCEFINLSASNFC